MPSIIQPNIIQPVDVPQIARFAIVVAQWNKNITSKLLDGALATFAECGVTEDRIDVAWVPGAWEIPLIAKRMAAGGKYAAIVCLGAVIRGETSHDEHINRGVSQAFMEIGLNHQLPVLFGVLTCNTLEQAIHRAGGRVGNKGSECADAALHMVGLLAALEESS